jgi:PAS domain S-box-containing protein/putative nucleotidyltransferase with HDIG domain
MSPRKTLTGAPAELSRELDEARQKIRALEREITALDRERRTYKDLFDKSPIGLFRTTPDGRVLLANRSMYEMLGFETFEEFAELNLERGLHANRRQRQSFKAVVEKDGEIRGLESVWIRSDRTAINIRESAKAVRDERGEILYYEGTVENVSEKKKIEEELKESLEKLSMLLNETVEALSVTVEKRDPYTAGHQQRVALLATAIARELDHPYETIRALHTAAIVHDIGKIYVPAEILSKPGRLSPEEMSLVKQHSVVGYDILKNIAFDHPIAEIVYQHHEALDGGGYPRGLSGEQLLPEARILSVADVTEALSTHRPYRPAFPLDVALRMLDELKGKLDPEVVDVCISLFEERIFSFDQQAVAFQGRQRT